MWNRLTVTILKILRLYQVFDSQLEVLQLTDKPLDINFCRNFATCMLSFQFMHQYFYYKSHSSIYKMDYIFSLK